MLADELAIVLMRFCWPAAIESKSILAHKISRIIRPFEVGSSTVDRILVLTIWAQSLATNLDSEV
jgi:hypothetical protein